MIMIKRIFNTVAVLLLTVVIVCGCSNWADESNKKDIMYNDDSSVSDGASFVLSDLESVFYKKKLVVGVSDNRP